MYGHNYSDGFPCSASFPGYNFPLLDQMTGVPTSSSSIMAMPPLNIGEYESSSSSSLMQNVVINGGGCTSSSSYGSPTSCDQNQNPTTTFMQRSLSLHHINQAPTPTPASLPPHFIWSINTLDFLDSSSSDGTTPVRRACSTGDLQGINMLQNYRRSESPSMSNEESCSSIIEGMSKASRYSPEEKRERIDKYRSKRNQRNFNKTIKYACRKTLADSRPRIRGRFARNDEIEKMANYNNNHQYHLHQYHHHHQAGNNEYQEDEEGDELEENWTHFLEPFSTNLIP